MKLGLVLGGGGARGIAHIQYLKALDAIGIKPDVIAGTSIGALVGALYASGMPAADIRDKFKAVVVKNFIRLLDITWHARTGIIEGRKLMKILEENLRVKRFSSLKIPLYVVTTDFWARKSVVISEGKILDAVHKSIAIPGVFEPVADNGRIYVDGCITNPVPLDVVHGLCDKVIAIDVISDTFLHTERVEKPLIFESLTHSFLIMQDMMVTEKMKRYCPDIYVKAPLGDTSIFDFHRFTEIMDMIDTKRFSYQVSKFIAEEQN